MNGYFRPLTKKVGMFALLVACGFVVPFVMRQSMHQKKAQAAWDRIEALGGHGVWERDFVVVSLGNTEVEDEDLALFRDFPFVTILNLSRTRIGDKGLSELENLTSLESLIVIDTQISQKALDRFQEAHPTVKVTTKPPPEDAINPFTGLPFNQR